MEEKNQLTISFAPDGTIQHTLNDNFFKPDFGVERTVQRMSDIQHVKAIDSYIIMGKLAPVKDREFDRKLVEEFYVSLDGISYKYDRQGVLFFPKYDEAVRAEIRIIDAMRTRGVIIETGEIEYTASLDLDPDEFKRDE